MLAAQVVRDNSKTLYIVKGGFGLEDGINGFSNNFGHPTRHLTLNIDELIGKAELLEELNRVGCLEICDHNLQDTLLSSQDFGVRVDVPIYDIRE